MTQGVTQTLSGRCGQGKPLLLLPVREPRTVQSVATHNTDGSPQVKYIPKEQYRNDVSCDQTVGYSLLVALSVGAANCYYRENYFVFWWGKRIQFFLSSL
jgi:hypothetical protein